MDECHLNITREIFPSTSSPFIPLPLQGLWWDQSTDGRNAALFMQLSVVFNTLSSVPVIFYMFLSPSRGDTVCVCTAFVLRLTFQPWLTMFYSLQNQNSVCGASVFKKSLVKEIYWPPRRHRLEIEEPRSNLSLVFHNSKFKWPFNSHLKRNQRI